MTETPSKAAAVNHDEDHDPTVMGFIGEYGMIFFFGTFFIMTMFLPLLFSDISNIAYWAIVLVLLGFMGLITTAILQHRKSE